jgi:hypothetical protein
MSTDTDIDRTRTDTPQPEQKYTTVETPTHTELVHGPTTVSTSIVAGKMTTVHNVDLRRVAIPFDPIYEDLRKANLSANRSPALGRPSHIDQEVEKSVKD